LSDSSRDIDSWIEPEVNEILNENPSNSEPVRVGVESEFAILDGSSQAPSSKERDRGIKDTTGAEQELGAAMAETQTPPVRLDSLEVLENALGLRWNDLVENMAEEGLSVLRYGTHPFVSIDGIETTDGERYDTLVETFEEKRPESDPFGVKEKVDTINASIPAAICSTQTNIQAESLGDAVEKANYANMVLPYAVALSGNSRIVDGKDTGIADARMPMWERAFNSPETPNKVGPTDGYFEDIADYYSRLDIFFENDGASAEEHLDDAVGEYWKDVRIKMEEDGTKTGEDCYPVVEVRPISMQPSVEEETAVHGFMLGRVAYAQESNEELIEFDKVMENRERAMRSGLEAENLYSSNDDIQAGTHGVLRDELDKAREGLEYLGIEEPGYLDLLEHRIDHGTPSEHSAKIFNTLRQNQDPESALREALPVSENPDWEYGSGISPYYGGDQI
jgi:gamma-glutamyl:cysteine ligase YbdK (ATP-grasp superfamily)